MVPCKLSNLQKLLVRVTFRMETSIMIFFSRKMCDSTVTGFMMYTDPVDSNACLLTLHTQNLRAFLEKMAKNMA